MKNELISKLFLEYIGLNYKRLFNSFKKADFGRILTEDLFHDAIIKVNDKILTKGFKITKSSLSGQSFSNYLFITCGNEVMMDRRLAKRMGNQIVIESDDDFEYLCPEHNYKQDEELQYERERIHEDLLVDEILQFIKKRHIALDCGIFEYYYRAGMGIRQLSKQLGYKSFRTVWVKIDKVRSDIIKNFEGRNLPHRIVVEIKIGRAHV